MAGGVHSKLERVRPPRVHIKFDVELEDGVPMNELPFVVGVMGDFSGDSIEPLKPMAERKFVSIDRDNINDVMKRFTPGLKYKVENTLAGDGSEMSVDLKFESMQDFEPAQVAQQVDPLRKLLETRDKLRDLLTKADRSGQLEKLLEDVLKDAEKLTKVRGELGLDGDKGDSQ